MMMVVVVVVVMMMMMTMMMMLMRRRRMVVVVVIQSRFRDTCSLYFLIRIQFFVDGVSRFPCITYQAASASELSSSERVVAHQSLPPDCALATGGGLICSMELSSGALHAGVHHVTAVLQHGDSSVFVGSSSILIRPTPPLLQQQHDANQEPAQFSAPLYRSDIQQPPQSLVPHVRSVTFGADADADADADDTPIDNGSASVGDDHNASYSLLKGDSVSGGGMKLHIIHYDLHALSRRLAVR